MWKEMRAAMLLHKLKDPRVIQAQKVLEMATVNGARALGINAGVLKAGCLADIIIVDLRKPQFISSNIPAALLNGASGCDVRTVIVDGKVLMEDHFVTVINEKNVIDEGMDAILRLESECDQSC